MNCRWKNHLTYRMMICNLTLLNKFGMQILSILNIVIIWKMRNCSNYAFQIECLWSILVQRSDEQASLCCTLIHENMDLFSPAWVRCKRPWYFSLIWQLPINSSPPGQNGRHFADYICNCIFLIENVWISFKISLKFVPNVRIDNIPAWVQIMAWRQIGDKPLS